MTTNIKVKRVKYCRSCHEDRSNMIQIIDLGMQPAANNLLDDFTDDTEYFPLCLIMCTTCGLFQLGDVVNPDYLFKNYLYHSSTSASFIKHFVDYAKDTIKKFGLSSDDLVIDIGSNDGILLKPFQDLGMTVLGVDPATKIAEKATKAGIPTTPQFFSKKLSKKIQKEFGSAKIITANNVFAHIDNIDEVVEGVKVLLDKKGTFIIEAPYLWNMFKSGTFDLIYHEHLSYFDVTSLNEFFKARGLVLFDIKKTKVHGGSMRYYIGWPKKKPVKKIVTDTLAKESRLFRTKIINKFQKKVNNNSLRKLLSKNYDLVVGYGAAAKATTFLNYYRIDSNLIDIFVDDSKFKHNKYIPGTGIEIVGTNDLANWKTVKLVVVFAWNFLPQIEENLKKLGFKGKIITPFI